MKLFDISGKQVIDGMLGPKLDRYDSPDGRRYKTPNNEYYYSVTTFLKKTESEEKRARLDAWRARVGDEEADRITNYSCEIGTRMHLMLEKRLDNDPEWIDKNEQDQLCLKCAKYLEMFLSANVSKVLMSESRLYSDKLKLAGTTDALCIWKNKLAIVDFKNSRRGKSGDDLDDYRIQATVYAKMAEEVLRKFKSSPNIRIEHAAILVAFHGEVPRCIEFNPYDYENELYDRLSKFHLEYPSVSPPTTVAV